MMKMLLQREPSSVWRGAGSLATPDESFLRWLNANKTASGTYIDETIAMNFAAVFAAVTIWCNAFAMLPWAVYQRRSGGGKDERDNHPVSNTLNVDANPEMGALEWRDFTVSCLKLWGNAYSEIIDGEFGPELMPLHPRDVTPERLNPDGTGRLIYRVREKGRTRNVEQVYMLHFKSLSADGITGRSVIQCARESLGLSLATERHGATFFGNGAHPSGIVQFPREVERMNETAVAQFRTSFRELYSGENAFNVAVLQDGATYQQIGMPNEDAQFLETRAFQVLEIARWFNLPPHMLGHLADATFSNVEHQELQFARQTLAPETVRFNAVVSRRLFTREERREGYFAELDLHGMMRGDHAGRAAYYKTMREIGAMNSNEIRQRENMNGIGPAGDFYLVPQNMTTADAMARAATQTPEEKFATDTLQFKRDLVKLLVQDHTLGDVIFNRMEATTLLRDANVPVDAKAPPVPWMPVLTDTGQLVSGEVIRDSEGDIVGGDVLEAAAEPPDAPEPNPEGDAGEGAGEDAAARREAAKAAAMPVFVDACGRIAKRKQRPHDPAKLAEIISPAVDTLARMLGVQVPSAWLLEQCGEMAQRCAGEFDATAEAVTWTDAVGSLSHAD